MSIKLEYLTKRYGNYPVVNNVSLEIADSEFFVLLGPSGSGKSTVLRMIAGLNTIDQGRVLLRGRDVTHLQPQQRDIGFVFQNYALFRHMTVADNVEFALRIRKAPPAERRRQRDELLELVGLAGLGRRMPHQLSGGQQQRVALARALAHRPAVLLLDEPFGALDAKIRIDLRRTLKDIQREIGMTTLFVTHDQEEAFGLADRLGIMNMGRLLEVGRPEELYQRPQTEFVATFLGTANLLLGQTTPAGIQVGQLQFPLATQPGQTSIPQRIQVLFRPEDVELAPLEQPLAGPELGVAEVEQSTFVGSFERLRLRLPPIPGIRSIAPPIPYGQDDILLEAMRTQEQARCFPLRIGDHASVGVRNIHALVHPGLSFLILTDGSPSAQAAITVGGHIARLAHARTTLLGYNLPSTPLRQHLQEAREQIGSEVATLTTHIVSGPLMPSLKDEVEHTPYDLAIIGLRPTENAEIPDPLLLSGEQHLLLVPQSQTALAKVLICVTTGGEPGKEDVLFAGRLARHLGAKATLLSVLPEEHPAARERAERFLQAGVRTLTLLDVQAQTRVRIGAIRTEILAEMAEGKYDMLVLGAPVRNHDGDAALSGVVGQIISGITNHPVLIVRSRFATSSIPRIAAGNRQSIIEEVIR